MSFNHFDDRGQAIMVDITEKKKDVADCNCFGSSTDETRDLAGDS